MDEGHLSAVMSGPWQRSSSARLCAVATSYESQARSSPRNVCMCKGVVADTLRSSNDTEKTGELETSRKVHRFSRETSSSVTDRQTEGQIVRFCQAVRDRRTAKTRCSCAGSMNPMRLQHDPRSHLILLTQYRRVHQDAHSDSVDPH
jgi:hypothetical protein